MMSAAEEKFTLASAGATFLSRTNDVFGSLDVIAAKHDATEKARSKSDRGEAELILKKDPEEDVERQDFKSPVGIPAKAKSVPGFVENPDKWVKYDLSDVTADQLTQQSNAKAWSEFLDAKQTNNAILTTDMSDFKKNEDEIVKPTSPVRISFAKPLARDVRDPKMPPLEEFSDEESPTKVSRIKETINLSHLEAEDGEGKEKSDAETVAENDDASSNSSACFVSRKRKRDGIRIRNIVGDDT